MYEDLSLWTNPHFTCISYINKCHDIQDVIIYASHELCDCIKYYIKRFFSRWKNNGLLDKSD